MDNTEDTFTLLANALYRRFRPPTNISHDPVTYGIIVEGEKYGIRIEEQTLRIIGPDYTGPMDAILTFRRDMLHDVLKGREELALLFMTGEMRVSGSLQDVLLLQIFFPKYEQKTES